MANEWVKVELYGANNDGNPIRFSIGANDAVSKGTLMMLKDERAASSAIATTVHCVGVTAEEKLAKETEKTSISCWTQGIFEVYASGAIILGYPVKAAEQNYVQEASAAIEGKPQVIGWCLGTAADKEVVNVRLDL